MVQRAANEQQDKIDAMLEEYHRTIHEMEQNAKKEKAKRARTEDDVANKENTRNDKDALLIDELRKLKKKTDRQKREAVVKLCTAQEEKKVGTPDRLKVLTDTGAYQEAELKHYKLSIIIITFFSSIQIVSTKKLWKIRNS